MIRRNYEDTFEYEKINILCGEKKKLIINKNNMETIFFCWWTNPDYKEIINRPITRTKKKIQLIERKRELARRKRK
jgi:hypothetical protein